MNQGPPRTGRTSLSSAELYLLDALFDVEDRLGALNRDGFLSRNLLCSFDHDAATWERLVRRLKRIGLVQFRRPEGRLDLGPWVSLTLAGGTLWETERNPDWSRFCEVSARPLPTHGPWIVRVRSTTLETAENFFKAATACGLYAPDLSRQERRRVRARVVPWKTQTTLFELRAPLIDINDGEQIIVDWAMYERHRTWWRCISELIGIG